VDSSAEVCPAEVVRQPSKLNIMKCNKEARARAFLIFNQVEGIEMESSYLQDVTVSQKLAVTVLIVVLGNVI
jgi:hypothetical protein